MYYSTYEESMEKILFDKVQKDLKNIPTYIVDKLLAWAKSVELKGIRSVRLIPSYHDEPLSGNRKCQRSIRLSKAYRAIYSEKSDGTINLIIIEEVNKHDY